MEIATINDPQEVIEWLLSQLPASVVGSEPEISIDADELLIILNLNTDTLLGKDEVLKHAERELIGRQRGETRALRVQLARQLEGVYNCAISWGMRAGGTLELFTANTVAVMTRLSRTERRVLDTLIATNVANTRSAALGYIVRTFAAEHQDWLDEAQEEIKRMADLRTQLRPQRRNRPLPLDSSKTALSGADTSAMAAKD